MDAQGMAHYAWALLNGACDAETQAEFDALALEPMQKVDHSVHRQQPEPFAGWNKAFAR